MVEVCQKPGGLSSLHRFNHGAEVSELGKGWLDPSFSVDNGHLQCVVRDLLVSRDTSEAGSQAEAKECLQDSSFKPGLWNLQETYQHQS